jgi:hypothetical protein
MHGDTGRQPAQLGGVCAMRASVLRRVRPIVDAQLGIITSAQLRDAGVDAEVPRRERWLRLADGLWVVHDDPSDEQLLVALGLYSPGALASGPLACRWYGLRHAPQTPGCHALLPHGTTLLGGPLLRMHQTRRMPDPVEYRGRTLAPVARAVAETTRWSRSLQDSRAVVLAALADKRVTRADLAEDLAAGWQRTSARLRRALEDWDRGARSAPEAEAADALLALPGRRPPPPFLLNPELRLDGVLLGSPDGYLPEAGLGWEMDSEEFHGDSDTLDETLVRHQRFSDAGIPLLHVTPSRFRGDRAGWAADIAERARKRIRSGERAPSGLVVTPVGPLLGPALAA